MKNCEKGIQMSSQVLQFNESQKTYSVCVQKMYQWYTMGYNAYSNMIGQVGEPTCTNYYTPFKLDRKTRQRKYFLQSKTSKTTIKHRMKICVSLINFKKIVVKRVLYQQTHTLSGLSV